MAQEPGQKPAQKLPDAAGLQRRVDGVPVYKAESRLVVVDVVVRDDRNHPVAGLKKEDFLVREDGVVQTLVSVDEHTMSTPRALAPRRAETTLPPNTFSNDKPPVSESSCILLVLDALGIDLNEQMRERQEMLAYMKTVPSGTRIAMVQLDTALHLVQGFSSDPATLLAAVKSKRDFPDIPPLLTREKAESIIDRAVAQITGYLSYFPGRKTVIWFGASTSAGELTTHFWDRLSFLDEVERSTPVLTLQQIAVYVILPGAGMHGFGPMPADLIKNLNIATPNLGITSESVGSGWAAPTQQMLQRSGGDLIYNTNDVRGAIQQIADGAWNYYTLTYAPANRTVDGRYRHLDVEVPGQRLHLQHRQGYYARTASVSQNTFRPDQAYPEWLKLDAAMQLGGPSMRDILFTAHLEPGKHDLRAMPINPGAADTFSSRYRDKPFRRYVVTYNVHAENLQVSSMAEGNFQAGLKLLAVLYDGAGNVINSHSEPISEHMTASYYHQELAAKGIEASQTIEIPARGNFFLRLGIEDELSARLGVLEIPVDEVRLPAGASTHPHR